MSNLLKILAVKKKDTLTGTVVSKDSKGYYQIRTGGRIRKIKSAVSGSLSIGMRVVVTDTEDGLFIIGMEKLKSRTQKEVTISG